MFKTTNFVVKFRHTPPSQLPPQPKFGEVLDGTKVMGYGGYLKKEDYISVMRKTGQWSDGSTMCEIYRDFNYNDPKSNVPVCVGFADCSPKDNFNRKDGRYFATINALFQHDLSPDEKHEIANVFLNDSRNEDAGYGRNYFLQYIFEGKQTTKLDEMRKDLSSILDLILAKRSKQTQS